jgi:hypothetical protein
VATAEAEVVDDLFAAAAGGAGKGELDVGPLAARFHRVEDRVAVGQREAIDAELQ